MRNCEATSVAAGNVPGASRLATASAAIPSAATESPAAAARNVSRLRDASASTAIPA